MKPATLMAISLWLMVIGQCIMVAGMLKITEDPETIHSTDVQKPDSVETIYAPPLEFNYEQQYASWKDVPTPATWYEAHYVVHPFKLMYDGCVQIMYDHEWSLKDKHTSVILFAWYNDSIVRSSTSLDVSSKQYTKDLHTMQQVVYNIKYNKR